MTFKRRNVERLSRVRIDGREHWITGRVLTDGSITLSGAPTNKTWIRSSADSREKTTAWGVVSRVNTPVETDRNKDGDRYIVGADFTRGTVTMGAGLIPAAQPPINELYSVTVDALGFIPGRVAPSSSGTTYVSIAPFDHNGALVTLADVDLASYYPALASEYGRIGVYYNPLTAAAVGFAGSHGYDETVLLTTDDRASVPAGMIPLGAVIVSNDSAGDPVSISSASRFESWRGFVNSNGYLLSGSPVAAEIASGVLAIGDESVVTVDGEGSASDALEQVSVTGAPRWIILNAASGVTITLKQYIGGSNNIYMSSDLDLDISGEQITAGWWDGSELHILAGGSGGSGGVTATIRTETVIHDETLGANGQFDLDIASGYTDLIVELTNANSQDSGAFAVYLYLNSDTTLTNYASQCHYGGTSTSGAFAGANSRWASIANAAYSAAKARLWIPNHAVTGLKSIFSEASRNDSGGATIEHYTAKWSTTDPITHITLVVGSASGNFTTGTHLKVVGVKNQTLGGGDTYPYEIVSANQTFVTTDNTYEADTASITITLLNAASVAAGKPYRVINASGGSITVDTTSSQTIGNTSGAPTSVVLLDGEVLSVVSNGANWRTV